jgi:hypothetical protein
VGRHPVGPWVSDRFEVTSTAQLFGTEALGHPARHLSDVAKLCSLDEDAVTPKDLSFLAASAPRAGSGGRLFTRKGYRPRIRSFEEWGRNLRGKLELCRLWRGRHLPDRIGPMWLVASSRGPGHRSH